MGRNVVIDNVHDVETLEVLLLGSEGLPLQEGTGAMHHNERGPLDPNVELVPENRQ